MFTAKSKAACGLCFDQLGGHVELPWLMHMYDVIHENWKYITYLNAARGGPSHGHIGRPVSVTPFAVHGPMVWNSLSDDLRAQQDYESFRQGPKTWLFSRY